MGRRRAFDLPIVTLRAAQYVEDYVGSGAVLLDTRVQLDFHTRVCDVAIWYDARFVPDVPGRNARSANAMTRPGLCATMQTGQLNLARTGTMHRFAMVLLAAIALVACDDGGDTGSVCGL